MKQIQINLLKFIFITTLIIPLAGCSHMGSHKPSIPQQSDWRVIEMVGGEGSGLYGIEGDGIKIGMISRLGFPEDPVFSLDLHFSFDKTNAEYEYDPSESYIKIVNRIIHAKGLDPKHLPPHYQNETKKTYRKVEGIESPRRLQNFNEYITLFFDTEPPDKNTHFIFKLGGLRKNKTEIVIPEILFVEK